MVAAAAAGVVMVVIAAAAAAAATQDQQQNNDQPDAGTVVVKAHGFTSLVLLWTIIWPGSAGGTLSGRDNGEFKHRKGSDGYV